MAHLLLEEYFNPEYEINYENDLYNNNNKNNNQIEWIWLIFLNILLNLFNFFFY